MIGKTIARLRKAKGLTQTEFASQMEVHQSLVTRWERDVVQPRAKTLEKMAEVLDISVPEILAGDYNGVATTLNQVDDPDLMALFGRVHQLNTDERSALKIFLEALLTRIDMEQMVTRRSPAAAAR